MARRPAHRSRLVHLLGAGLVDSLCLSVAWTVVVLQVADRHGLAAAGLCTGAGLVGVAVSAPVAGVVARRLDGRGLLRVTAAVEAVLRLGVFALLVADAPLWLLALAVGLMNVSGWTGYAGMRAEVAAVSTGAGALTAYATVVAAVEAVGVAVGAMLPAGTGDRWDGVLLAVVAAYVLALVPTVLVAGGSTVPRAPSRGRRPAATSRPPRPPRRPRLPRRPALARRPDLPRRSGLARPRLRRRPGLPRRPLPLRRRPSAAAARHGLDAPVLAGALLMLAASGPTLLAVALAGQWHGRSAVAVAAVAFTAGSLAAPLAAARLERWRTDAAVVWGTCAVVMLAGWLVAPLSLVALCVAQVLSGLAMTSLEGLLDTAATRRRPREVTGALARASSARALGSAAATAALPLLLAGAGPTVGVGLLLAAAVVSVPLVLVAQAAGTRRRGPRHARPAAPAEVRPAAPRAAAPRAASPHLDAPLAAPRPGPPGVQRPAVRTPAPRPAVPGPRPAPELAGARRP